MTAYVVSGLGQAKDAGYKIDERPPRTRAAPGSNPRWPRILR